MTDRELLQYAAKAAGYKKFAYGTLNVNSPILHVSEPFIGDWSPIVNDEDAFKLAIDLKMTINVFTHKVLAIGVTTCEEYFTGDPYAATRRAITRIAADMGKSIK